MNNEKKTQLFCYLEKDRKTLELVNKFYNLIMNNSPTAKLEAEIQQAEIEKHLNLNSYNDRASGSIDWINIHGKSFRSYINSLKIIALYIYTHQAMNNEEPVESISCDYLNIILDIWNTKKLGIIDTIFI